MPEKQHLVVTVPKGFWGDWIAEGDAVGEPETGEEWGFFLGGHMPEFWEGQRLYIVAHGRVRGYAPVTRIARTANGFGICRRGGAVAVTIQEPVRGFQGWRYRWWEDAAEVEFPEWKTQGVA
jgi:hypothetical protein